MFFVVAVWHPLHCVEPCAVIHGKCPLNLTQKIKCFRHIFAPIFKYHGFFSLSTQQHLVFEHQVCKISCSLTAVSSAYMGVPMVEGSMHSQIGRLVAINNIWKFLVFIHFFLFVVQINIFWTSGLQPHSCQQCIWEVFHVKISQSYVSSA